MIKLRVLLRYRYLVCSEQCSVGPSTYRSARLASTQAVNTVVQKKSIDRQPASAGHILKISSKKRKNEDAWKISVLNKLHAELQDTRKDFALTQNIRNSSTQLIRFAVDDDILSIISFMNGFLRTNKKRKVPPPELDKFIAICTLLISRHMNQFANGKMDPNDRLATSICFSFENLWKTWSCFGPDTKISLLLLYTSFERWSRLRLVDEHTSSINFFVARLKNTVSLRIFKYLNMNSSTLLLSETDWNHLNTTATSLGIILHRKLSEPDIYDPNLKLVNALQQPLLKTEVLQNPFAIKQMTKKDYLAQLDDQLGIEKTAWLKVNNVCKDKTKNPDISAEDLIEKWRWKHSISEQLETQLADSALYSLNVYLGIVDRAEVINILSEAAVATCSLGQNLVPIGIFENNIVSPVMQLVQRKLMEKLGIDVDKAWRKVMSDYLEYFEDASVARTNTHRAWWYKCCWKNNVPPDYQIPFSNFHGEMRRELLTFFKSVMFAACKYPAKTKHDKIDVKPAFSVKNVAIEEASRISPDGRYNLSQMVKLDSSMMKELSEHQFNYIMFPTGELPMTVPPKPWIDRGLGGPEFTRSKQVLRRLSEYKMVDNNLEMGKRLADDVQARPVFDALNQLGSMSWIINEPMLDVLSRIFSHDGDPAYNGLVEKLSVPIRASSLQIPEVEKPVESSNGEVTKEQWREFYKQKDEINKNRNEMNSLWYWMMYRVVLAQYYRGQVLFFPHNMDFRGRVYPISPYLNHMGDDVNRCILKFAKGKPLGEDGLTWLKLHCINLTGKYKRKSIAERLRVAEEFIPEMLDSANDPLSGRGWWLESEEPWQTLAACMELRDALSFPGNVSDFISHLPIHQDGSCNGLQHYAALGRDKQGGLEVNLLPSDVPNDVYSSVAARVEQKRLLDEQEGENMEIAQRLRVAMPQAVPRKVIKQTVMTTVYGVTMYGAVLQIKRQLKAVDIDNTDIPKFASYLAKKTFESLNDAFTSSMQLKDWFRACAKGTNELLRTMEWVTPLGLPVVQPYLRDKMVAGRLILTPMTTKQIDAFPPNFVHSLDSTHMMLTSLECSRRGTTFAAVHDCFWTHASTVKEMNEICRQQFVRLHSEPIVQKLSDWFLVHYLPEPLAIEMSEEDRKRFRKLFTPQVQQGILDITDVSQSVYFFS